MLQNERARSSTKSERGRDTSHRILCQENGGVVLKETCWENVDKRNTSKSLTFLFQNPKKSCSFLKIEQNDVLKRILPLFSGNNTLLWGEKQHHPSN